MYDKNLLVTRDIFIRIKEIYTSSHGEKDFYEMVIALFCYLWLITL